MALWRAKQATITIASLLSSVSTTQNFNTQQTSATDFSGDVKNVSISGAEADVSPVYTFGTTSGVQNAEVEEENMTMREVSFTMVFQNADAAELALASGTTMGGSASTFKRIRGDTTRTKKSIVVQFSYGTNRVNILMNNAYFTKLGDISLDAEGYAEQEITAKCLASDYYEEDNMA